MLNTISINDESAENTAISDDNDSTPINAAPSMLHEK